MEPSRVECDGVLARMFSGAGMEAVSNSGVCLNTELGVGEMVEAATEVKVLVGLISADLVFVRVTVMNLVLFWSSSMLKV